MHKCGIFLLKSKFLLDIKFLEKLAFEFFKQTQIEFWVFLLQNWEFFAILTVKNILRVKFFFFTENYAQMCNFFVKVKILICYSIFGEISILIWATNTNFGYTWLRNSSQFGTPLGPRPGVLEYSIVMERGGGPAPRPGVLEYS